MSQITQEQVLELESNARFQSVSKQFIRDRATYLASQIGTTGNLAGLTPTDWAKQRILGAGFLFHPNSQNYQEWVSQFCMFLKGADVWVTSNDPEVTSADATITAMIASGKFDELSTLTFTRRSQLIEF